jgi:hypothetical protein
MQQPQIPKIVWFILGLLLLMSFLSISIAIHNPSGRSYPRTVAGPQGAKGDAVQIDYNKLAALIHNEVAALPQPKDGVNGKDGKNGVDGKPGVNGKNGQDGAQGIPGADGKSIELRYNAAKSQIEWRFSGDIAWITLVSGCVLTNTCAGP